MSYKITGCDLSKIHFFLDLVHIVSLYYYIIYSLKNWSLLITFSRRGIMDFSYTMRKRIRQEMGEIGLVYGVVTVATVLALMTPSVFQFLGWLLA